MMDITYLILIPYLPCFSLFCWHLSPMDVILIRCVSSKYCISPYRGVLQQRRDRSTGISWYKTILGARIVIVDISNTVNRLQLWSLLTLCLSYHLTLLKINETGKFLNGINQQRLWSVFLFVCSSRRRRAQGKQKRVHSHWSAFIVEDKKPRLFLKCRNNVVIYRNSSMYRGHVF